jgi:hypothetical protein
LKSTTRAYNKTNNKDETMPYEIKCNDCGKRTKASQIVDLITKHVNESGRFVCKECSSTDTYIYKSSVLQENGETWERWIRGIIQIQTDYETYSPYVFLTASGEQEDPDGIHFNYYKDTRSQKGGRLKHGHGPGGAPVLSKDEYLQLTRRLLELGVLTKEDIETLLK